MRCEKCGCEIVGKTNKCPLCHTPLENDSKQEYQTPKPKTFLNKRFQLGYLITIAIINIVCITVNLVIDTHFLWSVIVLISTLYIFYFSRYTFTSLRGFHVKLVGQTVILTALIVAIYFAIGGNYWIYITWLPIVYFVSDTLMLVYINTNKNKSSEYVLIQLILYVFGVIPVIFAYCADLSVKWPAISVTALNVYLFLYTIIKYRKSLISEFKKYLKA